MSLPLSHTHTHTHFFFFYSQILCYAESADWLKSCVPIQYTLYFLFHTSWFGRFFLHFHSFFFLLSDEENAKFTFHRTEINSMDYILVRVKLNILTVLIGQNQGSINYILCILFPSFYSHQFKSFNGSHVYIRQCGFLMN